MNIKVYLKLMVSMLTLTSYCCAAFIDTIARNHTDRQRVYNGDYFNSARPIYAYTNENNELLRDESKVNPNRGASQAEKEKIATAVFGAAWTDLVIDCEQRLTPDAMIQARKYHNPYNDVIEGRVQVKNHRLKNHFQILYWLDTLARFVVQEVINKPRQVIDADYLNQFDGYNSLSNLYSFAGFEKQTIAGWLDSVRESHKIGLNTRKAEAEVNLAALNLTKQNKAAIIIQRLGRGHLARSEINKRHLIAQEKVARTKKAAIAIQRLGRGHLVRSEIKKHHLIAQEKAARAAALIEVRAQAEVLLNSKVFADIEISKITPGLFDAFCEIAEQAHSEQRFDAAIMLLSDMIGAETVTMEASDRGKAIARNALTEIAERASATDYDPNRESSNPLFAAYILNHYPMATTDVMSTGGELPLPFNLLRFRDEKNKVLTGETITVSGAMKPLSIKNTNIETYECFNVISHSTHKKNVNAVYELLYCLCDANPFRYFDSAKASLEAIKRSNHERILAQVAAVETLREKTPYDDHEGETPYFNAIKAIMPAPQLYPLVFDAVIAISLDQNHPKWNMAINPSAAKNTRENILNTDLHIYSRVAWRVNPMKNILKEISAILGDNIFYERYLGYTKKDGCHELLIPSNSDKTIEIQIRSGPLGIFFN